MGIELPKYTIQTAEAEPEKFKKFLWPFLVLISLFAGYYASGLYANQTIDTLQERNNVLETVNIENKNRIAEQDTEISILKTEQKVKQQGVLLLQNDYTKSIDAQDALKAEIKFYEQLLSPDAENKGLRVFQTIVNKKTDGSFKLKATLAQKIERARNTSGAYKVQLVGKEKGLPKTLQIHNKDESKFNFKYFYTISLNFSLPEGFKPEQLIVELFPKNKKAKTVRYTVEWSSLINLG